MFPTWEEMFWVINILLTVLIEPGKANISRWWRRCLELGAVVFWIHGHEDICFYLLSLFGCFSQAKLFFGLFYDN